MSPPFDRFLRPSYLHHFLGEKPPTAFSSLIPMIKHDTFYCGGVNDFMRSPQAMYETHAPVMDRMENMFKPLYPFVTVRKSHGWIVIAKREGAVKLGEWQTRQEALQAFLAIIGADAVSAIMGSRNDDAQAVLAGTRAFRLSSSIEASTIASLSASGSVVLPSEAEPVCSYLPTPIAFGRDEREAGQVNDIRLKSLSMLMLRPSLLIICYLEGFEIEIDNGEINDSGLLGELKNELARIYPIGLCSDGCQAEVRAKHNEGFHEEQFFCFSEVSG